ncbi:MAG TPA: polysulfide reductase NrfD [Burkholderiaceae bacterium]|nr:polysulfide reductase NrfD [Burkholderiaceae bacterium]HQR71497.1 polysulfide reductase NrfD [Burkholderiaceae bacterium]
MNAPTIPVAGGERRFWWLVAAGGLLLAVGLGAAWYMEEHGHIVTGMSNEVVWGTPHVFAIFLIVAASGVLNIASMASVFGRAHYKPWSRLSGVLSVAMLAGGLMVLMLDLGRPERMVVAATHYNPTSVFAWNVLLYSGMFAAVLVYLWMQLEKRMNRYAPAAGVAVLIWRFVLTTGTGMIFAFLVARQAYASAVLPPLFIVMSLAWGMAVFVLVRAAVGGPADAELLRRMRNLLGLLIALVLYFMVVYHLTNLYFAKQAAFERFILLDGGVYPWLFWVGYVLIGSIVPMVLVSRSTATARTLRTAAALTLVGAFAALYVFIIGGQAFPLEIFPGYEVTSAFRDGAIAAYAPSLPEVLLGLGGVAAAFLITLVGIQVFDIVPDGAAATATD